MSDDTDETGQMGPRPLALEVTLPDRTFTVALPADGEVILGRSRSAGIQLDHASVSREHARLRLGPSAQASFPRTQARRSAVSALPRPPR